MQRLQYTYQAVTNVKSLDDTYSRLTQRDKAGPATGEDRGLTLSEDNFGKV